jgi:hypothetical protein
VAAMCSGGSVELNQGMESYNLSLTVPSNTTIGQHQLSVSTILDGATQNFTFPIYVVSFSGSLGGSSITLTQGGTGTLTAALNATAGFQDSVSLGCSGSEQISCSFQPSPAQVTGGASQSVTITLAASTTAFIPRTSIPFSRPSFLALGVLFPFGIVWGMRRTKHRMLLAILVGFSLLFVTSCGSGGNSGGGIGGGGSNNYTVTVTADVAGTSFVQTLGTVDVTVTH